MCVRERERRETSESRDVFSQNAVSPLLNKSSPVREGTSGVRVSLFRTLTPSINKLYSHKVTHRKLTIKPQVKRLVAETYPGEVGYKQ